MERDAAVASERPVSPDSGRLNLLQSACISLAASQASRPAADSDSETMERRERGSPAATAPDGPLPGAAPQNESSDADIFFEYDVESGAAGSASGGAAGGADTGCALTSPAGGSRDPSPAAADAVAVAAAVAEVSAAAVAAVAAVAPNAGDCQLARSDAVAVPGGGRSGGDHTRSAERPVPVQNGRRRVAGGSLGHRTQQSPSEKVDAWLRSCNEDSGASTEEDETGEQGAATAAAAGAAAVPGPDEPQFVLEEDRAGALEDSYEIEEMVDALGVDEVHDLRELMARGLELLDLDPELEPPALADREGEQLHAEDHELEGAVGGCEDPDLPQEYDCMLPRHQQRLAPRGLVDGDLEGAEGGVVLGAVGCVADIADADADDEAASTSGASSSFAPPDQLKRSTSLKSGKTPPHTPGRKKFVRFADAMGLDLQCVHTFRDEIPTVPAAAFRGLHMDARVPSPPPMATFQMSFGSTVMSGGDGAPLRHLVPMFLQPGGSLGFLDRLRGDRVVLENVTCNNDEFTVNGVVRVLNMDFHKTACVRYTLDEWRSGLELQAEYVPGSCDGLSDRFRFTLHAGALMPGERLHFVLRFECLGQQFWDNNGGENYSVQMICSVPTSPMDEPGDWSGGRL